MAKISEYTSVTSISSTGYLLGIQDDTTVRFPASTFKGEAGVAGQNGADGLSGVYSLVEKQTLSSDVSTVTFSGLDSAVDGDYILEYICKAGNTTAASVGLRINNDSTAGRYTTRYLQSSSAGTSGTTNQIDAGYLASSAGNNGCIATIRVRRMAGLTMLDTEFVQYVSGGTPVDIIRLGSFYSQDVAITSIDLNSGSGLFKTGSVFRLMKSGV